MKENNHYYALIMAGGVGSRFWPTSRASFPKQFQDLTGIGRTLLQQTIDRLEGIVPKENVYILTNEGYKSLVEQQLPGLSSDQIICEPVMRNTAPCILYAAQKIHHKDPDATMLVLPSDHFIDHLDAYKVDIQLALKRAASEQELLTFGIPPNSPHTGYGYLEVQDKSAQITAISQFTEKPTLEKAETFLSAGNYFWNSGMFVWSCASILNAFAKHQPDMHALFEAGKAYFDTPQEQVFLAKQYPKADNISIDYAILERASNIVMIKASFLWNDLGTWSSLHEQLAQTKEDNVTVKAHLISDQASGNMIYSSKEKVVVVKGLKDFVVVEEEGVLLIYPKGEDQSVKDLRAQAKDQFGDEIA